MSYGKEILPSVRGVDHEAQRMALSLFVAVLISVLPAHPIHAQDIRLIVRGADLGMTKGSIAEYRELR